MIKATIVGDSLSPQGNRLTSVLCTFPRIILAEVNTHKMLSKNTSSSRAISFNKMVEVVQNNPFIPIAWQKEHKGMQGTEYHTYIDDIKTDWLIARDMAVNQAKTLHNVGVTKQLCNRLLEPFMWTTMLITGSKEGWNNFFELRCPQYYYDGNNKFYKSRKEMLKVVRNDLGEGNFPEETWLELNKGQAEIHMMALAEAMWDAYNESTPKQLEPGQWHIPFRHKINVSGYVNSNIHDKFNNSKGLLDNISETEIKVATAMAARTSYTTVGDEKEVNYQKMVELHDRLLEMKHMSPFEHCARAMSDTEYNQYTKTYPPTNLTDDVYNFNTDNKVNVVFDKGWCKNFKGFIQYRYLIETRQ